MGNNNILCRKQRFSNGYRNSFIGSTDVEIRILAELSMEASGILFTRPVMRLGYQISSNVRQFEIKFLRLD